MAGTLMEPGSNSDHSSHGSWTYAKRALASQKGPIEAIPRA